MHTMKANALYIHIPFCIRKCPYCGFYSEPVGNYLARQEVDGCVAESVLQILSLMDALIVEIDYYISQQEITNLSSIYIGGGSPSCIPQQQLIRLITHCQQWAKSDCEVTVELNPQQVTASLLHNLRQCGVNRLSVGAQSFRQSELELLGRPYDTHTIAHAVTLARRVGFDNINLDLIFALPGTNIDTWRYNLKQALSLSPQHISAYSLSYEPGTVLYAQRQKGTINPVSEETDRSMYELTIDMLTDAGINQYEISNFARPGFACRHNLTYWLNEPYIGVGPAAGGFYYYDNHLQGDKNSNNCINGGINNSRNSHNDSNGDIPIAVRYNNIASVSGYIAAIQQGVSVVDTKDLLDARALGCEAAVLGLRLTQGIDIQRFRSQRGVDFTKLFSRALQEHVKTGMIIVDDHIVKLSRKALPVADKVLCDFALPD